MNMQLQTQAAMVRAAGCMKKSTEVMRCMNKLVKLPEFQKTMMEMQREMERSGLIEEVVGDALDELDGDDVEEETELQVNKVVEELAGDLFKANRPRRRDRRLRQTDETLRLSMDYHLDRSAAGRPFSAAGGSRDDDAARRGHDEGAAVDGSFWLNKPTR